MESLGIQRLDALHYYVRDLGRSRQFYTERLDFSVIAESAERLNEGGRQRSMIFQAGASRVVCSTPVGEGGRAHRYLERHPDGIGSLVFEVEDADRAFQLLEARGGTPIAEVEATRFENGSFKTFVITTPFGDTTFRFVERKGEVPVYPGFEPVAAAGPSNALGFVGFDHVTSNFETMAPALLWCEHVLGFERFWDVQFHTEPERGSGLRSVVMWDPRSGIKLANNEPFRPNFKASQINLFHEEHRGDGIQHVALAVQDIISAVRGMRKKGVPFMPTPHAYYEALPGRLDALGVSPIRESLSDLEELGILVDGDGANRYLLQIFLKDSAETYGASEAGPFFYEVIQRAGDQGFGAGNFRALFESIEREQRPERA